MAEDIAALIEEARAYRGADDYAAAALLPRVVSALEASEAARANLEAQLRDRVADLESAVSMTLGSWEHDDDCETVNDGEDCTCWRALLERAQAGDPVA